MDCKYVVVGCRNVLLDSNNNDVIKFILTDVVIAMMIIVIVEVKKTIKFGFQSGCKKKKRKKKLTVIGINVGNIRTTIYQRAGCLLTCLLEYI